MWRALVHCALADYLIGVVHEVNWDAEWQRVVVGVSQQDGDDLHAWGLGLPLSILQRSLHRPLTVHCILPYLAPVWKTGSNNASRGDISYFGVLLSRFKGSRVGYGFWVTHLGSALCFRYCLRYQRKCCWGRNRATHRDNSCQHYRK